LKRKDYTIPIYPNPAHDVINIDLNGFTEYFQLELNDLTGKTIIKKSIRSGYKVQLDIFSLPPGFYIIRLHEIRSEYFYFKKIIIY
jgi:hypothetical protein